MNMEKTQDVPEYEIEGLMRTLKELGIKGIMENTDVIVLNHIIERGYIPHHREGIISSLKENTDMEYGEIMELINKWDRWKKYLPSYSLKLNQKLDKINREMNSIVPFRYVGDRLIGFVENKEKGIDVLDGLGNHHILLGTINKENWSINWNPYWVINPDVNRYVVGEIKRLKENSWF
jgi:hypothetical protein